MVGPRAVFLWTLLVFHARGAFGARAVVTCVLGRSCVLPRAFSSGQDLLISWTRREGPRLVHDFYHGRDQLQRQHPDFRGRTALFQDQISSGNASLLLRDVRLQDQGTYQCVTSNGAFKRTTLMLRVTAPVVAVRLALRGQELLCGAENIFPRPSVTWSCSSEPLNTSTTSFNLSESGMFSVLSSVTLTQRPLQEHSCNVSTEHSWRSATYRRNPGITVSDAAATVSCSQPSAPVKTLTWRFNHRETIVTRTGSELVYTKSWRPFVDGLTDNNSLVLKGLTRDQLGLFTCEVSTETELFIIDTGLVLVPAAADPGDRGLKFLVLEWLTVALFFLSVIVLVRSRCRQKNPHFQAFVESVKSSVRRLRAADGPCVRAEETTELRAARAEDEETTELRAAAEDEETTEL